MFYHVIFKIRFFIFAVIDILRCEDDPLFENHYMLFIFCSLDKIPQKWYWEVNMKITIFAALYYRLLDKKCLFFMLVIYGISVDIPILV